MFVDDPERGIVDIHTPGLRLPFAGHPLVGAAWLLDLEVLELPAGDVFARQDGEFTWITARPEWAPPRTLQQYATAAEVDALPGPPPGEGWLYAWAWEDEAAGRVRARGLPEARRRHRRGRGDRRGGPAAERAPRPGPEHHTRTRLPDPHRTRAGRHGGGRGPRPLTAARALNRRTAVQLRAGGHALSGNTSPSSRKTAVFSAKARLHSSTIRCFSRSSAFTASSSSRYPRLKAAGLAISSKT